MADMVDRVLEKEKEGMTADLIRSDNRCPDIGDGHRHTHIPIDFGTDIACVDGAILHYVQLQRYHTEIELKNLRKWSLIILCE